MYKFILILYSSCTFEDNLCDVVGGDKGGGRLVLPTHTRIVSCRGRLVSDVMMTSSLLTQLKRRRYVRKDKASSVSSSQRAVQEDG